MENKKEQEIYFTDLYQLLVETTEEVMEDLRGYQYCCNCCSKVAKESDCGCVKRKEIRDGTSEGFTSAGLIGLETGYETVTKIANKVVEALKARSFVCECPPIVENVWKQ
ncbi:MAG: hypothetical protein V1649_01815 [Patescibacteria group bacterium]